MILAENRSGWKLLACLRIKETETEKYHPVTGAFAIVCMDECFLLGYNPWREQWELPAGGIEPGETAREAARRELYEETHQQCGEMQFKGLAQVQNSRGDIRYQAVYQCELQEIKPFCSREGDEMTQILLWDRKQNIGYVDECDMKILELFCLE